MLMSVLAAACWWAVFVLVFRRDRRQVRNGVLFLLASCSTLSACLTFLTTAMPWTELLLAAAALLVLLGVGALAVFLIANGLTTASKEGSTLGNALSLLAGVAILAAPVAAVLLVATLHPLGIGLGALLALVALHLGGAFLVFLTASLLYLRFPRPVHTDGIIVLGSGLVRGRVSRLLRGRLDRAVAAREELLSRGRDPLLVPSGGRGAHEPRAEAEAMAEYLVQEVGMPVARVRAETRSRTTEENLILSHRLLDDSGQTGPYLIATSRYHAFRAALLARSLGHADEAVGGPTAAYYVPTATLREFIAVMSYRRGWNLAALLPGVALTALLVRAVMPAA